MGPLTGGTIAGVIAVGVLTLLSLGLIVFGFFEWRDRHQSSYSDYLTAFGFGFGVLITSWAFWLFAMWPLAYDYHHWVRVEGRVQEVNKRIVSNGDGISQRFIVVIAGRPYGVDDTRATLIKEGDRIKLACKRDFEWGVPREANGWAFRWRGSE